MTRFGTRGVAILGNSMVQHAFDPRVIGPDVYNAALDRSQPDGNRQWLEEAVLPLLEPRAVVYGLAGFELNGSAGTRSHWDKTFRHLADLVNLSSSSPPRRVLQLVRENGTRRAARSLDRSTAGVPYLAGWHSKYQDWADHTTGPAREVILGLFNDFQVADDLAESLRNSLQAACAAGARTLIVRMPLRPEHAALFPAGGLQAAWERIHQCADDAGAEVRSLDTVMRPHHYADIAHLNRAGSVLASAALRRLLDSTWEPRARDRVG